MKILLVNPWIVDFKAYDEWMRPFPFYRFLERFRNNHDIKLIDCLGSHVRKKKFHTGDFESVELEPPAFFSRIPRKYKRYGISLDEFRQALTLFGKPDIVFITSLMTYWYSGVALAVQEIRQAYPETFIKLGGIYPTLLPDHARQWASLGMSLDAEVTGGSREPTFLTVPEMKEVLPLRVIKGCPDRCPYCATSKVNPGAVAVESVAENIGRIDCFVRSGGEEVVFYDDAPLYRFESGLAPLLHHILSLKRTLNLHFANGMHARMINEEVAGLLFSAGVKTLRLGFERSCGERKVGAEDLVKAACCLKKAGFSPRETGAYLMLSPGDRLDRVRQDARLIHEVGLKIFVNQFAPIPGSVRYEEIVQHQPEIAQEPLLQNDLTYLYTHGGFDWDTVWEFKHQVQELNKKLLV
ncbi:MAG: hypothetical protein A2293_16185 [Elusimicrobia bacterium RIFOXYB2_FULL_49_7]|nr:MAG: hypothetical protein A2293_16185 [Elusimicrobia bacterium RIFOXYB2_FULL_49_7]